MEVKPYLPSISLCRLWMKGRLEGMDDAEAWDFAFRQSQMRPRDLARTMTAGANGQQALLLSVAIEGGGSVVKRGHPELWRLSDHGRWPQIHLRALEAAYAATPFYPHMIGPMREILLSASAGTEFAQLTSALHRHMISILHLEELLPRLREASFESSSTLLSRSNELKREIGIDSEKNISDKISEITFFDVIFKKGPEALFTLL